jgi:2-C-methyl-D-erythritol 2,4-cyclodiphosphate synthase
MRVGFGYDSHRLVPGRPLILGGVAVPFARGLDGWSDADVLTHAVIDAVCGAAALGDIGTLFPSGDERFKNAASLDLLRDVIHRAEERGMHVANVDVVVLAEKPVLAPYVRPMRRLLAAALKVDDDRVSVKPKTDEGMGFVGRGEGIAAYAVVLLTSGASSS